MRPLCCSHLQFSWNTARVAAEKALPFAVKVPNATTVKALQEADRGAGKRFKSDDALFKDDLGI